MCHLLGLPAKVSVRVLLQREESSVTAKLGRPGPRLPAPGPRPPAPGHRPPQALLGPKPVWAETEARGDRPARDQRAGLGGSKLQNQQLTLKNSIYQNLKLLTNYSIHFTTLDLSLKKGVLCVILFYTFYTFRPYCCFKTQTSKPCSKT